MVLTFNPCVYFVIAVCIVFEECIKEVHGETGRHEVETAGESVQ